MCWGIANIPYTAANSGQGLPITTATSVTNGWKRAFVIARTTAYGWASMVYNCYSINKSSFGIGTWSNDGYADAHTCHFLVIGY